jgi:hypothetical protein
VIIPPEEGGRVEVFFEGGVSGCMLLKQIWSDGCRGKKEEEKDVFVGWRGMRLY